MTSYEQAKEQYKDVPRPTVEEFIAHSKNAFNHLAFIFGEGFVLQAVEIAEQLLDKQQRCGKCDMLYCECEEYE
jgi:uncharacterized membrane protein YjdF